jgi:hypothetical protein
MHGDAARHLGAGQTGYAVFVVAERLRNFAAGSQAGGGQQQAGGGAQPHEATMATQVTNEPIAMKAISISRYGMALFPS